MKRFELDKEQEAQFEAWRKSQMKKDPRIAMAGERWTFMFTPTGLGTVVNVKDNSLGDELDLTDWENW